MKLLIMALLFLQANTFAQVSGRQMLMENDFARSLAFAFEQYRTAERGELPTNWTMVEKWLADGAMDDRERHFLEFGDTRGFTNSIYEKYVFVPTGVKMPADNGGDLLLVSSTPMPLENGTLTRWGVYLVGTNLLSGRIAEYWIQFAFSNAMMAIPSPTQASSAIRDDSPTGRSDATWREYRKQYPDLFRGGNAQRAAAYERYFGKPPAPGELPLPSPDETNQPPATNGAGAPPVATENLTKPTLWPLAVVGLTLAGFLYLWWHRRSA